MQDCFTLFQKFFLRVLQLTKYFITSYSIYFTMQGDNLLDWFLLMSHLSFNEQCLWACLCSPTLLPCSCVSGSPGEWLLMNCALRQNHCGGGDGWSGALKGHGLPGGELISLLSPAPNPDTVFMKSLLALWCTPPGQKKCVGSRAHRNCKKNL